MSIKSKIVCIDDISIEMNPQTCLLNEIRTKDKTHIDMIDFVKINFDHRFLSHGDSRVVVPTLKIVDRYTVK